MAGSDIAREKIHVFVAASGKIQDHDFVFLHFRSAPEQLGNGMRRFERGNNSFHARQRSRRFDGIIVRSLLCIRRGHFRKPCVLGANRWVIEPRRNRMGRGDLPVLRLQDVCVSALQNAGPCAAKSIGCGQPRGVIPQRFPAPARFHAHHLHAGIAQECVKQPDGIRSAAHARKKIIRQPTFGAQNLLARFFSDNLCGNRGPSADTDARQAPSPSR